MGKLSKEEVKDLAVAVGIPLVVGNAVGLVAGGHAHKTWYRKLRKPKWTPPDWVFPVVWPVLYIGQGIASWLVWNYKRKDGGKLRKAGLWLYGAQLALNFLWEPLMFRARRPDVALVDSTACLGLAAAATVTMTMAVPGGGKQAAVASLMGPYVAWMAFASALNGQIWRDNPDAHKLADDNDAVPPAKK